MASCCTCGPSGAGGTQSSLPLLCLVPRDDGRHFGPGGKSSPAHPGSSSTGSLMQDKFQLLDEEYIKKNFKLPQRALYLDPFRRPLITFPMTQEGGNKHFNIGKKQKTNQQILDGFLAPSEAIVAPSIFPYATNTTQVKPADEEDEEIIYILQLPDYEFKCPIHQQTIRTPRFIWHSCKKSKAKTEEGDKKQGGGPMNKPKPWLLILTELMMVDPKKLADIPLARPGFNALDITAPILIQLNPEGKWEKNKPETLEEDRLRAVVQHLVNSRALSAAQSYCCQCAAENQTSGGEQSNYVPVIMMPIYPADQCPFDMDCEIEKMNQTTSKQKKQAKSTEKAQDGSKDDKEKKKQKKRGFVMQRLTDFDLMSQW